jgi:hypothetical protein
MAGSFRRRGDYAKRQNLFDRVFSDCFAKNQILSDKKPHPPMLGSGVESRFGFPRAYYLRRRRIRAKPPRPRRAVDDGSGMGAASNATPDETTLLE